VTCFDNRSRVGAPFFVVVTAIVLLSSKPPASSGAAEPVRLTFDGRVKRDPIVWPDGKQVTYTTVTNEGVSRLMRLNLSDGSTELFHPDENLPDRELTVSADGSVYAYVYVTPDGQRGRVIVKDTQQSTKMILEPGKFGLWPTLSPDGRHVAFTIDASVMVAVDLAKLQGSSTVTVEPRSGGAVSRLTYDDARYGDLWPKYSPDGKQIVFASRRDDDFEIYLMNADGSAQRRLTDSPGVDTHPSISPDGNRIVFTSARDRNYEIYTMKLDGSDLRRITNHPGRDDFACWHPDGKRLILVSQRQGRYDLYSINVP
jgi:TolB protein